MSLRQSRVLVVAGVAALFAVQCGRDPASTATAPPPIEIRATIQPVQSMTISAEIDGRVGAIAAREGATIATGGDVLQLENPTVERDAAYARAQREWIDMRASRAGRPARTVPNQPRANIEIASKILELRRQRFEKMKALRSTRDITARDLEQAEVEYLAALRDYNNERRVLAGVPVATEDPEALRIERAKVAAEEKFTSQRKELLRVTSPIAGVITALHVKPGQAVFPRDPIADVADNTMMQVRGSVAPELLRYIRPGLRVDVKVLSVPPRTFADEIDSVIPVPGGASRSATVVATIPNPDGTLQPNTEALITLRSLR